MAEEKIGGEGNDPMAEKSKYAAVEIFREIKAELQCDDATAAALVLAQCIRRFQVNIEGFTLDDVIRDGAFHINHKKVR